MNKIIKLLILAGTIVLICSVSVYFYQTQVANTPSLAFNGNQFVGNIEKDIADMASFDCSVKGNDPEELFVRIRDKFMIFKKYDLIDQNLQDELMNKFIIAYAGKFFESSDAKMKKPWNFAKESWRFSRASWLLDSVGSSLSPSVKANVAAIKQVESDYRSANNLLAQRSFSNMTESKSRVASAHKFKDDKYLSNCGSLAQSLSSYPSIMHNNHFAYISETVETMELQIQVLEKLSESNSGQKGRYDMSKVLKANYNRIYTAVSADMPKLRVALDDYDTKAQATYGMKKDIADLSKRVSSVTQRFYSLPRPENQ
ncbi:MAG: hypothetical protein MJ198_06815 [Bacteroidales bacterium]|nr:hypothetical protein [Bacteroidales bacterium]